MKQSIARTGFAEQGSLTVSCSSLPRKLLTSWDSPRFDEGSVASRLYLPLDIMADFLHFTHESILHHVSAKLYIWTVSPGIQASLGHLGWPLLIQDSLLQSINIFCLRVDLLHHLQIQTEQREEHISAVFIAHN